MAKGPRRHAPKMSARRHAKDWHDNMPTMSTRTRYQSARPMLGALEADPGVWVWKGWRQRELPLTQAYITDVRFRALSHVRLL
eukprot:1726976-Pyramimonas_sp.AAC.2